MRRIVVGDENGLAGPVIAEHRFGDRRDAGRVGHLGKQQLDARIAAHTDGAGHPDVAAHHAGQQAADGQAETRSVRLGTAQRTAFERRRDLFQIIRLDARASVDDFELGDRAAIMHHELHAAAGGELDRVGEQIDQDLPQPFFVGEHHGRQISRTPEYEIDALGRGLQPEHAHQLVQEFAKADFIA